MYTGLHALPERFVVIHANPWRYVCIQVCMHYQRIFVVIHANLWRYVCIHRFACITREVCGNTCKPVEICMYTGLHALPERFVVIHANCGDMYVYRFCTQRGLHGNTMQTSVEIQNLYVYRSPQFCMYYHREVLW